MLKVTRLLLYVVFLFGSFHILSAEDLTGSRVYLFKVEYVNYAWGYQHNGCYIDNKGNVFRYRYSLKANFENSKSHRGRIDRLDERFNYSETLCGKIEKRVLDEKRKLAILAQKGSYSTPSSGGADRGKLSYMSYIYDPDKGVYKRIILRVEGDWEYKNELKEAEELVAWLKSSCKCGGG